MEQIYDILFSSLAHGIVRWGLIGILVFILIVKIDEFESSDKPSILIWPCIIAGIAIYFLSTHIWFLVLVYIIITLAIAFWLKRVITSANQSVTQKKEEYIFTRTKKEAETKGDFLTYHELAKKYEHGDGIKRSLKQAEIWYRKAAECGDAKEKREFGKRFEVGDHIARKVDMEEAQRWYDAADQWEKEHNKK